MSVRFTASPVNAIQQTWLSGLRSSNPLLLGIGAADAANSGCGTQYDRGIPKTCWPR